MIKRPAVHLKALLHYWGTQRAYRGKYASNNAVNCILIQMPSIVYILFGRGGDFVFYVSLINLIGWARVGHSPFCLKTLLGALDVCVRV